MSDTEESVMEEMVAKHSKEKKEMRAKIVEMKKNSKSGNKKQQKETNDKIEEMEKEMKQRHEKEIGDLKMQNSSKSGEAEESTVTGTEDTSPQESEAATEEKFYKEASKKTKAMKRRDKKEEDARRFTEAMKEDKVNAKFSQRNIEWEAINRVLSERGLTVVEVPSDGDCLFNAVADQLVQSGQSTVSGKEMRKRAAKFMRAHPDDFLPFITMCDVDGQEIDDIGYLKYCEGVETDSKTWGGELELIALSRSLEKKIEVIQPDGRILSFGEEYETKPLVLTFHRHAYSLGEHYNSTVVAA